MKQGSKLGLEPKLRFPEFHDEPAWEEKRLYEISKPVSDKATESDAERILTLSSEYGIVLQSDYFDKRIAGKNVDRYTKINFNDFVYNDRVTKSSAYGTIKRLSQNESGIVSPIYKSFRFEEEENPIFWEWYFESGFHEAQLHDLVNEGARTGRFNISIESFLSISVWCPNPSEQQKIADCLSSLDDLIAAQNQKLDTLKAHKKGLLQQLFPAEGETLPKLRFPEFRSRPEWERTPLAFLCNMRAGQYVAAIDISEHYEEGLYPCYGGNGLRGYTKTFTHSGTYPLIGRQGALCGNVNLGKGQFHATEHAVVATPKTRIDVEWLFYNLVNSNLNQYATGQAQPGLSVAVLERVNTAVPTNIKEQQKIADCLSSLDERIAVQNKKMDALKSLKKGLMQQLFPSPDEVQE